MEQKFLSLAEYLKSVNSIQDFEKIASFTLVDLITLKDFRVSPFCISEALERVKNDVVQLRNITQLYGNELGESTSLNFRKMPLGAFYIKNQNQVDAEFIIMISKLKKREISSIEIANYIHCFQPSDRAKKVVEMYCIGN